jgi:ferredoxin
MKTVTHTPAQCIGCMACTGIAPDLFQPDPSTGLAKLVDGEMVGDHTQRQVEDDAVPDLLDKACPGGAISVTADIA